MTQSTATPKTRMYDPYLQQTLGYNMGHTHEKVIQLRESSVDGLVSNIMTIFTLAMHSENWSIYKTPGGVNSTPTKFYTKLHR
jgi:hypothetical protein